jgi:amino acid transporter
VAAVTLSDVGTLVGDVQQTTREGLVRVLRKWDLLALTINIIIGGGIFGLPSEVFGRIGAYSLIAFGVCAVGVTLLVLCFAEVSSRFSVTGGPYLYAREAFGPLVGFEVGWLIWIARLTGFAANCNLMVAYAALLVPAIGTGAGRVVVICAVVLLLTMLNVVGVRQSAIVGNVLTVSKLAPLVLFVAVGIFFVDVDAYSLTARPAFSDFSVSVLLLVYAFTGFETAVVAGGEARDPRRDYPWALLVGIAVVAMFYLLIQFVAIGTFPQLGSSSRPIADASSRFLGPLGVTVITLGVVVSVLGNLNVTLMVASRQPFAMAQRGELPRVLAATHNRFHTPYVAILVHATVALVLTLSGTFVYAVTISVIARLLSFAATCLAVPVLRHRRDCPPALFLAPAGVWIAAGCLLLVAWLLFNITLLQARDAGIAATLGLVIYLISQTRRKEVVRPASC